MPNISRPLVRRSFAAAVISLAVSLSSILGAGSASAATPDCLSSHCYSEGLYALGPHPGAYAALPLTNMASGPADFAHPYHISSEMWVSMDAAGDHYIEAGIADGFQLPDNSHQCTSGGCLYQSFEPGNGGNPTCVSSGCGAYELFWSDTVQSGTTSYQYHHVVRFLSPNPSAVEYIEIYYAGNGQWDISFTGAYTYTAISATESAYHQTKYVQWGAEYYGPNANGECGSLTKIGAEMLGTNRTLIPVEMAVDHIQAPFTGQPYLSEWDWSLPGSC